MSRQEAVQRLLDAAFRELQHDTGPQDPEYVHQRAQLAKEFNRILSGFQSSGGAVDGQ
jgi:hypothetical protein